MTLLETERLIVRELSPDDAAFVLTLFNEPSFIRFVGDRDIRTLEAARAYIETRFMAAYGPSGLGAYGVERKSGKDTIGLCTLLERDWLDDVDLGFAFLPAYWSRGYAFESASALMDHVRTVLRLPRLVTVTTIDNEASAKLLARLGFGFAGLISEPGAESQVRLFSVDL